MPKKEVDISKVTLFKFRIVGMGSELAWKELDKGQLYYWLNIYRQSETESEAQRELVNHVRHDSHFPNQKITSIKKVDFIFWQTK